MPALPKLLQWFPLVHTCMTEPGSLATHPRLALPPSKQEGPNYANTQADSQAAQEARRAHRYNTGRFNAVKVQLLLCSEFFNTEKAFPTDH